MPEYRIYFLDKSGAIEAREEFVAANDGDAIIIGGAVADACSEQYAAYEIWAFARRVIGPIAAIPATWLAEVQQEHQHQILALEDALQRSRWAVAKSQRLIEKTNALRTQLRELEPQPAIEPLEPPETTEPSDGE